MIITKIKIKYRTFLYYRKLRRMNDKLRRLKTGIALKKYEINFRSSNGLNKTNIYSISYEAAKQMFYKLCKIKYPIDSKILG